MEKVLAHAQPGGIKGISGCAALFTENSMFSTTHSLQEDVDQALSFYPAALTLLGTNDYLL